jgi:Cft2 family RNA processing exonuclease
MHSRAFRETTEPWHFPLSQLHTGMSLEVFKMWAHVDRNMIILPGYCVPGTVGNKVIRPTSLPMSAAYLHSACE